MNSFTDTFDEKVRPLMDKIDRVRATLSDSDDGVVFPTVVVVGDQSTGKSTLLEALSLVELPKGSGIVTRCPLVLRLRKSAKSNVYHVEGEKRTKLSADEDIPKYIEKATIKLAGGKKRIVTEMIELEIQSPSVRDLTVVDLPGISRNPIDDQPKDIHSQTTSLIRHFIRREGTIILCVFPANVDVATVESFTLAREVDPEGVRTIGVITKCDLSPNATLLCQQLLMEKPEVLHLKLGFVAVRNRAEDETISLQDGRKREVEFFENHLASSAVGWHCLGVNALINRLADLYADRVTEMFPKIRNTIQNKLDRAHAELMKFQPELDAPARLAMFHVLVDYYLDNFVKVKITTTSKKCVGLVHVLDVKFQKFKDIVNQQTKELETSQYAHKVDSTMSAASGNQLQNFTPHYLVKHLVNEKIDQLWATTQYLINDCFAATLSLLLKTYPYENETHKEELLRRLLPQFGGIVNLYLVEQKKIVYDKLLELTRNEKNEPYTINSDYMYGLDKLKDRISSPSFSTPLREMVCSIRSYWEVIRNRFMDYVTLTIRSAFVFDVYSGVRERFRYIPTEHGDFVDTYLGDDPHTRDERKKLQQTCDRLQKVLGILGGRQITDVKSIESLPHKNELDELEKTLKVQST